jgi:hypothetical protein
MVIDRKARFTTMSPDEITVSPGLSIPNSLEPIVSNAPKEKEAIDQYLKDLVADGKITTDDVTFLIDSGALQN